MPSSDPDCPVISIFFSYFGAAFALAACCIGSGYGTAKSALGAFATAVVQPGHFFKALLPIIMAGIVGLYGLATAIVFSNTATTPMHLQSGYADLWGGIACGVAGLSAGFTIGISGDACVRAVAQQPQIMMGSILILIFGEVLGLYGFIMSIIMHGKGQHECVN